MVNLHSARKYLEKKTQSHTAIMSIVAEAWTSLSSCRREMRFKAVLLKEGGWDVVNLILLVINLFELPEKFGPRLRHSTQLFLLWPLPPTSVCVQHLCWQHKQKQVVNNLLSVAVKTGLCYQRGWYVAELGPAVFYIQHFSTSLFQVDGEDQTKFLD